MIRQTFIGHDRRVDGEPDKMAESDTPERVEP
jgi:hypothetical protein